MFEIYILQQLLKILKSHRNINVEESEGDLYGLKDPSGDVFVLSCCLNCHQLQHDPTFLISSSYLKLGSFRILNDAKSTTTFSLQREELMLQYVKTEEKIEIFVGDEKDGPISKRDYAICDEKYLYDKFLLARISYNYYFSCRDKTADVKNSISKFREDALSPNAFFKLKYTNMLIQNKPNRNVFFAKGVSKDANDEIGSLFKGPKKKHVRNNFDLAEFSLLFNKSSNGLSSAPVAQVDFNTGPTLHTSFEGEAILYLAKVSPISGIASMLAKAIAHQLPLAEFWLLKQLQDNKLLGPLKSYAIKHFSVGYMMAPIYPSNSPEAYLKEYRKQLHMAFLLPLDIPIVRKLNTLSFLGRRHSHVLINPHEAIPASSFEGCEVGLVQGSYGYHHYMQDKVDDNKWGCAYRSLQTLVSWFRMQGYTDEPIPSHTKIQQVLVDMKDKPAGFVGSKQWIGSTEVGFVLENLLHISTKFVFVSSGADLASKGRELLHHFNTTGTPIMVGGGVLAHTILGVSLDPSSGDIKFLILDPHYTGGEDVAQILKHGWCGWKGPQFWDHKAYYNLCLPQRPISF